MFRNNTAGKVRLTGLQQVTVAVIVGVMRTVLALGLAISAISACAKDPTFPTEIYLTIGSTIGKQLRPGVDDGPTIERVEMYGRSAKGTQDVVNITPFPEEDIQQDEMQVRLTPTPDFDPEFLLRCEGYIGDTLTVSKGEVLTFIDHARQDLDIVMDERFVKDDQDRDGYRLCGTLKNDTSPCDCDDTNPDVNPFMIEICPNGIDDDCSGVVDDCAPLTP